MESLRQPKPMVMEGDLGVNWKKFKRAFQIYLTATGATSQTQETRIAIFLYCIGEQVYEIYEKMELTAEEKGNYKLLISKFEEYFMPKNNKSVETHKFNTRLQLPGENFDNYLTELRKLAANCDFETYKDRLITDRIVSGVRDPKVKERLLREPDLNLTKAVNICKTAEQTDNHIRQISKEVENTEVCEVKQERRYCAGKEKQNYK
ncbi:hypothetical protein NQ315_012984 [Exocentrus adspersus]|uniref:Retrotransposon gag domain-containing protein n=1 Tax=Exocentrus adspersus TaxID=1586481 RepID=A0AAV8VSJ3_9CUCU|nr:hypothetical protein NQ315_012984 [Exocentrus adspersus]